MINPIFLERAGDMGLEFDLDCVQMDLTGAEKAAVEILRSKSLEEWANEHKPAN